MTNVTIGVLCSLLGAVVGVFTIMRLYKQDTKDEAASSTRLADRLDYISNGVDDIRIDIKTQAQKIDNIVERLARVEESTKSAHHRIDGLEREE